MNLELLKELNDILNYLSSYDKYSVYQEKIIKLEAIIEYLLKTIEKEVY